jgi:hypothetical protein
MVAHHEQLTVGNLPLGRIGRRVRRLREAVLLVHVRLLELHLVDVDEAILDLDAVATDPDHALDERGSVRLDPVRWRVENDDVAALEGVEPRGELVDEHVLVRLERLLHRLLFHPVRLGDECLDDEEDDQGQDECLDHLEEAPERRAFAHK